MKSLTHNLTSTSNAIDAEVVAKHRQFTSAPDVKRWLSQELHQLARTKLETASPASREAWLKRLFANLRLHHMAQVGEPMSPPHNALSQEAEVEVLDILMEKTDWERLCALGNGTYEQLIHQLRAMAMMGITVATSSEEYVTRFCTEYRKFSNPTAEAEVDRNWLPLLLSIRTALKASPIVEKAVEKLNLKVVSDQVVALPNHMTRRPASPVSRERIVSFSAVLGLLIVCGAVLWGGPTWKRSSQSTEPTVTMPLASQAVPPTAQPVQPTPRSKVAPSPAVAAPNQIGFYVIGVAARQEASAQAEAQLRRQEGLQARVVYSSDWSGLTPNYYLVVYGVFANRADTGALRKDLEKRGIKTYIMHSGKRVRP